MNAFDALNSTAKLVVTFIGAVIAGLLLYYLSAFFTAKSQLKEIRQGDARIAAAAKVNNSRAKARDNAVDAFSTANQQQARALAKELSREDAVFDDRARDEYFRVLNHALRGAER